MPVSFSDFNKDTKDLLTKNYASGAWKVESKGKGGDGHFVFNPAAASGKPLSMDVEYNCKPIKTKTNISEAGVVKPKITWEQKPNKVESTITYNSKAGTTTFDANYELKLAQILANIKYDHSKKSVETFNSFAAGNGITVGSGLLYNLEKPDVANQWNFGVQYAANGVVANVTTKALKSWTAGAFWKTNVGNGKVCTGAFQIDNKMNWTVGGEGPCFTCTGAKLRGKINQDLTVSAAWINKLAGGWKGAFSAEIKKDGTFGWGSTFTYE